MRKLIGMLAGLVLAVSAYAEYEPTAILNFSERGVKLQGKGKDVADLLFANLIENPNLYLVDRTDMDKLLKEAELNLSGMVNSAQANQIGQFTGAKLIITGSLFSVGQKDYIVAKIIGTETTKVLGASVNGTDPLDVMTKALADKIGAIVEKSADKLIAPVITMEDTVATLKKTIGEKKLPSASISIKEEHVSQKTIDPAAETEMSLFYKKLGGVVTTDNAEYSIVGEGFSEFATRVGNLISVKARLEVKVLDRAGNVVAIDRQTSVKVDLSEQIAGKSALQEAASKIAVRILPQLAK